MTDSLQPIGGASAAPSVPLTPPGNASAAVPGQSTGATGGQPPTTTPPPVGDTGPSGAPPMGGGVNPDPTPQGPPPAPTPTDVAGDTTGSAGTTGEQSNTAGSDETGTMDNSPGDTNGETTTGDDTSANAQETGDGPGGSEMCMVGTTSGNEVVFIGESFIAASSIPEEVMKLARENGSLNAGESYIDASVSGTRLGDGAIPRQYTQTAAQNPIRFVLMNGGGNDCLQAGDSNSPIPAAEALYAQMAADGVEKVVYFFYPDAAGAFGGPSSQLQTCLNEYRPKIKALCESLTAPKCYWLDLAETSWKGNESNFTTDGIHPNAEGSRVTAEAIWQVMVDECVAR